MKKKLLAALLASALAAGMLPTSACAASDYTTATATLVTLTDSSATAKGKYTGYEIDGTDVSITAAGTYVFSGDCDNGSITVKKGVTGVTLVLNGLTLSFIFIAYSLGSIAVTFAVTAGTFGAMAVIGTLTKKDLTSLGNLFFMALIGLIIASLVNLFWQNSILYWIVTYAGVLIFVGLTAYDAQKIKRMYLAAGTDDSETVRKIAVLGALTLYLDFINLFLYLLRIFGGRRN